jgi:hypothetical protein
LSYLRIVNSKTGKVYDSRGKNYQTHEQDGNYDREGNFVSNGNYSEKPWRGESEFDLDAYLDVKYAGDKEKIQLHKNEINAVLQIKGRVVEPPTAQPPPFDFSKMDKYK